MAKAKTEWITCSGLDPACNRERGTLCRFCGSLKFNWDWVCDRHWTQAANGQPACRKCIRDGRAIPLKTVPVPVKKTKLKKAA